MSVARLDTYKQVLQTLKERVLQAQHTALQTVNTELISLYWDIGKTIVEQQEHAGWGKSVVEKLAKDLQAAFPSVRGFSAQNLWRMRQFYATYRDSENLSAVLRDVSWTHHLEILQCKDNHEREFYLKMTKRYGWSYRALSHHIDGKAYERWLLNQTNFDSTLAVPYKDQAKLTVRDDYNFDFLELSEPHLERELEEELVHNISQFLGELGGYFAFIGRRFRVVVDEREFFLDLLFYNRELQCLVALELKTGEFEPEYGSKMNFYLSALDATVKLPHEHPSIGIIICKSKSRTIVEYTLKDVHKPIAVATYNQYATLKDLPERIAKYLPSPEEIAQRLSDLSE
jgi:predicted nuclease of restriction endonuclease-like (RecB) superfamily